MARASEEIAIAERDEVVPGSGEAAKRVAAVVDILPDQQILGPAGQALVYDHRQDANALLNLRALNDPRKRGHVGLEVACLQGLEGVRRELTDAIVLQMDEVHQAGVVLENAHRVLSAAMNPVNI